MKEIIKFAGVLGLVMLIAAGALAYVNGITKPRILAQQKKDLEAGLYAVLPGSESGVVVVHQLDEGLTYYEGFASSDTSGLIGYALPVISKGYSSNVRTLVGIDTSGEIIALKVLFQQETPGLGTRIEEVRSGATEPWFTTQFKGKYARDVLVDKDGGDIQSITGATITSRAVTNGIRNTTDRFMKSIGQETSKLE